MRAAAQCLPLALAARVDKRPKEEAAGGRAGPMEKARGRGCVLSSSALTAEANGPAWGRTKAWPAADLTVSFLTVSTVLRLLSLMWLKPMPSRNAASFRV